MIPGRRSWADSAPGRRIRPRIKQRRRIDEGTVGDSRLAATVDVVGVMGRKDCSSFTVHVLSVHYPHEIWRHAHGKVNIHGASSEAFDETNTHNAAMSALICRSLLASDSAGGPAAEPPQSPASRLLHSNQAGARSGVSDPLRMTNSHWTMNIDNFSAGFE